MPAYVCAAGRRVARYGGVDLFVEFRASRGPSNADVGWHVGYRLRQNEGRARTSGSGMATAGADIDVPVPAPASLEPGKKMAALLSGKESPVWRLGVFVQLSCRFIEGLP